MIIGMLYLFSSESPTDIMRMCLYENVKENKLNLQNKIMMSVDKKQPNIGAGLHRLAVDSHFLDGIT